MDRGISAMEAIFRGEGVGFAKAYLDVPPISVL